MEITKEVQEKIIKIMSENPEKWGDSKWNLDIYYDGDVDMSCCSSCESGIFASISMRDFDADGWFLVREVEGYEYLEPIEVDKWHEDEMFSISNIDAWCGHDPSTPFTHMDLWRNWS